MLCFARRARIRARAERKVSGGTSNNGGEGPSTSRAGLPRAGGTRPRVCFLTPRPGVTRAARRGQVTIGLSYQGRGLLRAKPLSGTAQFKCALLRMDGSET